MYHFFFADVALANNSILYHKAISHCLLSKLRFLQTVRELKDNIFNKVLDLTYLIFLYKEKEADLKEKVLFFFVFFRFFLMVVYVRKTISNVLFLRICIDCQPITLLERKTRRKFFVKTLRRIEKKVYLQGF